MNYPLWDIPLLGGSLLIAIIAVLHVFIAMFAVGGGLFLVTTEARAYRENDHTLLEYVKRHSRFFLLLTVVLGAVTGVGIWFIIGLVNPQTTSILIRIFVWGWAIEWCFFILEIGSGLLYFASWDRVSRRTHLLYGWTYAVSSFLTMVIINGIVSFMLTPGHWLQDGNFWSGFFNPTYLPSLVGRAAAACALAGLWGLVTALRMPEPTRAHIVRHAANWLVPAMVLMPISGLWYLVAAPEAARALALGGAAPVSIMFMISVVVSVILFAAGYFGPLRRPEGMSMTLAVVMLSLGLIATGGSEWVREGIRKPYTIYGYLYSNGVFSWETAKIREEGVLASARWTTVDHITQENAVAAGAELFRLQCSTCHTLGGYNDVAPLVRGWDTELIDLALQHLDTLKGYMPPFFGTDTERRALAMYLAGLSEGPLPKHAAAGVQPVPGQRGTQPEAGTPSNI